jgi:heptosyltransferase-2
VRLGRFLAREQFDVCVDLQNNRQNHLVAWLSGAHTRAGYANGKASFLLNLRVRDLGFPVSPIEHQFQILKLLGFTEMDRRLELWTRPDDDARVEAFLKGHWIGEDQAVVGIHPAASAKWPTKAWLPERYAELCDLLSRRNIRVVITGDAAAARTAQEIVRLAKSKPVVAAGRTSVTDLVALVRRFRAFVTSDSAPMHVAAAVGTPFVALFGPTDPRRHVAALEKYAVIRKELKCSPCYLRKCPIGHLCMKRISSEEVYERVMEFIRTREAVAEAAR